MSNPPLGSKLTALLHMGIQDTSDTPGLPNSVEDILRLLHSGTAHLADPAAVTLDSNVNDESLSIDSARSQPRHSQTPDSWAHPYRPATHHETPQFHPGVKAQSESLTDPTLSISAAPPHPPHSRPGSFSPRGVQHRSWDEGPPSARQRLTTGGSNWPPLQAPSSDPGPSLEETLWMRGSPNLWPAPPQPAGALPGSHAWQPPQAGSSPPPRGQGAWPGHVLQPGAKPASGDSCSGVKPRNNLPSGWSFEPSEGSLTSSPAAWPGASERGAAQGSGGSLFGGQAFPASSPTRLHPGWSVGLDMGGFPVRADEAAWARRGPPSGANADNSPGSSLAPGAAQAGSYPPRGLAPADGRAGGGLGLGLGARDVESGLAGSAPDASRSSAAVARAARARKRKELAHHRDEAGSVGHKGEGKPAGLESVGGGSRGTREPQTPQTGRGGSLSLRGTPLHPLARTGGQGSSGASPGEVETENKASLRAIKNRESAARSRQRRQEYTMTLEAEVALLQEQNRKLRERVVSAFSRGGREEDALCVEPPLPQRPSRSI